MDKYLEMAFKVEVEKMTITTISDAINEGLLPQFDAILAAYKTGDQCEAGKALFAMINGYLYDLAEIERDEMELQSKQDEDEFNNEMKREDARMRSAE